MTHRERRYIRDLREKARAVVGLEPCSESVAASAVRRLTSLVSRLAQVEGQLRSPFSSGPFLYDLFPDPVHVPPEWALEKASGTESSWLVLEGFPEDASAFEVPHRDLDNVLERLREARIDHYVFPRNTPERFDSESSKPWVYAWSHEGDGFGLAEP